MSLISHQTKRHLIMQTNRQVAKQFNKVIDIRTERTQVRERISLAEGIGVLLYGSKSIWAFDTRVSNPQTCCTISFIPTQITV